METIKHAIYALYSYKAWFLANQSARHFQSITTDIPHTLHNAPPFSFDLSITLYLPAYLMIGMLLFLGLNTFYEILL